MKIRLMFGLIGLMGAIACDADGNGDGSGSSTTDAETTGAPGTATAPTTSPPPTTGETSGQTVTATSSSTSAGTSSGETTDGGTTTEGATGGSSTGEPETVTPCQPEMARQQIDAWRSGADDRMPTFGEIAVPMQDFGTAASVGGFTNVPDPMAGGLTFIMDPDGGGTSVECSLWDQDCPAGEKCAAWANDGGSSWNASRCVPIAPDPVGVGEACTVEGSGVSGIDDCELGVMCWDVDDETNVGTCVALCEGPENNPTCAPEATACSISNEGVLILCLPICNPLAAECDDGQGCFPIDGFFLCAPVAGEGEPGEPCQFINACSDGGACVSSTNVPGCAGMGCCTAYCNLEGDGSECLAGQECMPWYEMGQEPDACLEGVGICTAGV